MKLLILGLIFGSISYIGYKYGDSYKIKQNFYNEFLNFLIHLKSQINFLKMNLLEIIDNYQTKDKNLKKILNDFKENILNDNEININLSILTNEEKLEFQTFFNGLGKSDLLSQNEFIEKNIEIFEKKLEQKRALNLKYGVMYKKLGILFAFFICIVLI